MKRLNAGCLAALLLLQGGLALADSPRINSVQGQWSQEAQALMDRALADLDPTRSLLDGHVHIVGTTEGGNGCWANPRLFSYRHPLKRLITQLFLRSGGGRRDGFDAAYMARLLQHAKAFPRPVKFHILAMDYAYLPDGTRDQAHTDFYVPNDYVFKLAEAHPECFVPVISVHPYRKDALDELDRWAAKGVKWVKWLPNGQRMDPADPRCDGFYARMAKHGMSLLVHSGDEHAVDAKGAQALGNPLRLRRPLDAGVRVVVAHCASAGRSEDLDQPGRKGRNFDFFLRLMGEKRYEGRLFGDLSAMTQFNRISGPYRQLLNRPELHGRLLNGSDWPLPDIDCLVWLRPMNHFGMLEKKDRSALVEIYRKNPLLFDFLLKRVLKDDRTGASFGPGPFLEATL